MRDEVKSIHFILHPSSLIPHPFTIEESVTELLLCLLAGLAFPIVKIPITAALTIA